MGECADEKVQDKFGFVGKINLFVFRCGNCRDICSFRSPGECVGTVKARIDLNRNGIAAATRKSLKSGKIKWNVGLRRIDA